VGALALGLLPLAPSLAQVSVATTPPADPRNAAPDVAALPPAPVVPAAAPASASLPTTPLAVGEPEAVTATVAEVPPIAGAPAPAAPEDADASIINDLKSKPVPKNATGWGNKSAGNYASGDPRLDKARDEARNEVHDLSMKLKLAEQRLKELEMAASKQMKDEAASRIFSGMPKGAAPAAPGAPTPPPVAPGYYPPKTNFENDYRSSYSRTRLDRNASRESRLDSIEANLKALLDEVHALRDKPSSSDPAPRFKEPAR
jgi:hypothetical protein